MFGDKPSDSLQFPLGNTYMLLQGLAKKMEAVNPSCLLFEWTHAQVCKGRAVGVWHHDGQI